MLGFSFANFFYSVEQGEVIIKKQEYFISISYYKSLVTFFLFCCLNSTYPHFYSGNVIARDLKIPGVPWIGHLGIYRLAYDYDDPEIMPIMEAMPTEPSLHLTNHSEFVPKSPFWGMKDGLLDVNDIKVRFKINNESWFQYETGCSKYNIFAKYYPKKYHNDDDFCPVFRCDTFVNYLYHVGGVDLPTYNEEGQVDNPTLPDMVFDALPHFVETGTKSLEYHPVKYSIFQIETIDSQQVNKLSESQLYNILDVYGYHFNDNSINNIFTLIESNEINNDKKYMLFQRLLGEMKPQHIPKLIEYYHQMKSDKKISHFILSILETDYQLARRDNKNFENCEMLNSFFKSLKNSNFNSEDTSIIDRANHYLCK